MTRHYMALCYLLPCGLALIAYRVVVLVPRQIVAYRSVWALRPSPTRINPAVMRMSAIPGKNDIHH